MQGRSLATVAALALVLTSCAVDEGEDPAVTTVSATSSTTAAPGVISTTTSRGNLGTDPTTTTAPLVPLDDLRLGLEEVGSFAAPVFVTTAPGDDRLFVVDQPGQIFALAGGETELFLDLRDAVDFGGERGLLGLAFHPAYADNGLFYVNYINRSGDTVIAEFAVAPGGAADVTSQRLVLEIAQPAGNHNGGMIAFGPDGMLWIGMGDGGGANDQFRLAQNGNDLNGSMLRIGVGPGMPTPYGVPSDNVFVGTNAGRSEIWAIGLRNPWRWSFDGQRLYIGDVGQGRFEEVNVVDTTASGLNFGWSVLEGNECFRGGNCDAAPYVAPVLTYGRGNGCTVIGGYVYRGAALPELNGHYFYSDYCQGWVRSVVIGADGAVSEEREWPDLAVVNPTSYGVDAAGELFITSQGGPVYRVVRAPLE